MQVGRGIGIKLLETSQAADAGVNMRSCFIHKSASRVWVNNANIIVIAQTHTTAGKLLALLQYHVSQRAMKTKNDSPHFGEMEGRDTAAFES